MQINSIDELKKLPLSMIDSVYSGQARKCRCGCSGTHNDSAQAILRMYNKFLKVQQENLIFCDTYVCYETTTRCNIIYYRV